MKKIDHIITKLKENKPILEVMEKLGFIERTGVGRAIKYQILERR
ncbi:hypothetical protein FLAV_02235 [Flavobacteriales bacterium]|uniref:ATP-dependent DNA helicase RecG C-terminal domain-containing protein n=1 Tax=Candidatus Methanoperedens nitratireducens TaxID=1392998 RepID=A0A0P7ZHG6_9EURY|nr:MULTISPECIES: hypothetical protein [Methanoperedens]KPQ43151.1 MAG: hypothetical protein MPEBLZ_02265 [Candidatus Methanoperedens sp. BLZ1]MCX9078907.1 hypothetical protein [Candidatus Methanoperedens sp.]CAG0989756.1 hypothetical protein FLAV_02235 [Flavobacteriales bacterium]MCX9088969.1 hypothetical protein [Candidatus Methanoperedens sp.]SNQ60167.1 hypothetical protein MNV_1660009 [Candidatus Methanoperedens nitroreducens]